MRKLFPLPPFSYQISRAERGKKRKMDGKRRILCQGRRGDSGNGVRMAGWHTERRRTRYSFSGGMLLSSIGKYRSFLCPEIEAGFEKAKNRFFPVRASHYPIFGISTLWAFSSSPSPFPDRAPDKGEMGLLSSCPSHPTKLEQLLGREAGRGVFVGSS